MKKLLLAITLLAISLTANASCSTHTVVMGDQVLICTTCCFNGTCTTTCN